jgi:hypothetical protein
MMEEQRTLDHRMGSDESYYSALGGGDHRVRSSDDTLSETEEMNVNWCLLALRVASLVLLLGVVLSYAMGQLDARLLLLGAILAAAAAICLIASFFECFKQRVFVSRWTHRDESGAGVSDEKCLIESKALFVVP